MQKLRDFQENLMDEICSKLIEVNSLKKDLKTILSEKRDAKELEEIRTLALFLQ